MSSHAAVTKKQTKKRRRPHALLIICALVLAAAVLLAGAVLIAPLVERVDETPVAGSADWMARLDGSVPLNELALPGSHESAARFVPLPFFNQAQALGIRDQLDAGVRLLDLCLAPEGTSFKLVQGEGDCRAGLFGKALTLDEVLDDCYAFLDAHPSETLLLAVSQASDGGVRSFQLLLDAYLRESPERWLLTDRIPTLGEARGKLVLLRRYEDEAGLRQAAGIPFLWRDQVELDPAELSPAVEPQDGYTLCVQDRSALGVEDKWEAFLAGVRGTMDGTVSLSFLSTRGDTSYGHPYEIAKTLNERLMEADDGEMGGWIMLDFVSPTLAERIYRLNF